MLKIIEIKKKLNKMINLMISLILINQNQLII
jgi:hypothetical protein